VVVTVNYRLGLFGHLSESHLNAEGHLWGNYGILDTQAALRWYQCGWLRRPELGGPHKGIAWEKPNGLVYVAQNAFRVRRYVAAAQSPALEQPGGADDGRDGKSSKE
jgi:Carboxylesterase family